MEPSRPPKPSSRHPMPTPLETPMEYRGVVSARAPRAPRASLQSSTTIRPQQQLLPTVYNPQEELQPEPLPPIPALTSERDLLHSPSPLTPQTKAPPKPLKSSLKKPKDTPPTTTNKKVSFDAPVTRAELSMDLRGRRNMHRARVMTTRDRFTRPQNSMPPYSKQENDIYWSSSPPSSNDNNSMSDTEMDRELIEHMRRRRNSSERDEAKKEKQQERDEQRGIWTKLPGVSGDYETLCLDETREEDECGIGGTYKMTEVTDAKKERQKIIDGQLELMKKALAESGIGTGKVRYGGLGVPPIWKARGPLNATTERQMIGREDLNGGAKENRRLGGGGQKGMEDMVKSVAKEVSKEVGRSSWWNVLWPGQNDDEEENSDDGMAGGESAGGATTPTMPQRTQGRGQRANGWGNN